MLWMVYCISLERGWWCLDSNSRGHASLIVKLASVVGCHASTLESHFLDTLLPSPGGLMTNLRIELWLTVLTFVAADVPSLIWRIRSKPCLGSTRTYQH